MLIKVYKIDTCSFCKGLIKALREDSIEFVEIDADDEGQEDVVEKLEVFFGSSRYPKIIIEREDKTVFINPEVNRRLTNLQGIEFEYFVTEREALNLIKKHII